MRQTVSLISTPTRYTDDHINYWGDVYCSKPEIRARGILFESFLFAPREFLEIVERGRLNTKPEARRKLQQRAVQWTLDDKRERTTQEKYPVDQDEVDLFAASASNQNHIPLRHHAYPRRAGTTGKRVLCRRLRNFWRRVMA